MSFELEPRVITKEDKKNLYKKYRKICERTKDDH